MTLEGAINFSENNDYTIYTMNSTDAGQYGVVLPKVMNDSINMLIDMHMKSLFDSLSNGSKTRDDVVKEIEKEYLGVKDKYAGVILVFPMLVEDTLVNAINNSDKQKMFDEVKKIGAITSEIHKKLTDNGIDKNKISQKVIIVEKDDNDIKFVDWLKEQMPNFVDGVDYKENASNESVNPFENVNPFANASEEVTSNEEKVEPVVENANSESIPVTNELAAEEVKEEVIPVQPVENNINEEVKEVESNQPIVNNDIFGTPVQEQKQVEVESTPVQVPPVVEEKVEPAPVENVELNGTTTFSPIVNTDTTNNNSNVSTATEVVTEKKNGGFANLIIILVILVGVTIASIELGKYLYSVFGA